jgi:hypothetical protein
MSNTSDTGEDPLSFLQAWYQSNTNRDWEHEFGVEIGTFDNPGWRVQVDVTGTPAEGRRLERKRDERSEVERIQYWSDGTTFEAAAGPLGLGRALDVFKAFALSSTRTDSGTTTE